MHPNNRDQFSIEIFMFFSNIFSKRPHSSLSLGMVIFLLCGNIMGNPAHAAKKDTKKESAKVENSFENRMAVFQEVFAALDKGEKNVAVDNLISILDNPAHSYYHVDAYAQLGTLLEELSLPYSALLAYQKALATDASRTTSSVSKAIELAEKIGDTAVLESMFTNMIQLDVDAQLRSRIAYFAAREAFRRGDLGPAFGLLQMVQANDPDFPEAQNLQGVIMSQQDRAPSAIAPFQIAYQKGLENKKSAKFQDAVLMNMARAYFTAKNYPQAVVYYNQVPRSSFYWADAQFEKGWGYYHMQDMNGLLGTLHTLNSPFFQDEYYAEAELLRIYGLINMCKFEEANRDLDHFATRFTPQKESLAMVAAKSPKEIFALMRKEVQGTSTEFPQSVVRKFAEEDRLLDSIRSVEAAEQEISRLQSLQGNKFSTLGIAWLTERKDAIEQSEGQRIQQKLSALSMQLQTMLVALDISRLDILDLQTQMLNRAAELGKMEEAKRQVSRSKRRKKNEVVWDYQGEYWADEVGYYQFTVKSECPASM